MLHKYLCPALTSWPLLREESEGFWGLEREKNKWVLITERIGLFHGAMEWRDDTTWVGKKPIRRIGGMSDALSIAAELGFSVAPPPSQEELQSLSTTGGEKGDDLIRVLRELTAVQRKIADLQVELQGRKDDKNVAHLTHVSEMEKKIDTLSRITTILKDVIQNKDRIISRLQQPYSLDCIPVEAEYQKQFSELLMKAASDYGALTASAADFQWSQNFKESPSVWGEMLRPIPVALASCTRFFEAMSAMRESFATLQNLRVGHLGQDSSQRVFGDSEFVTPPWRNESSFDDLAIKTVRRQELEQQEADDGSSDVGDVHQVDDTSHRRLSWPPSVKHDGI
ncbi:unnamed protein product [Dovyalis caffra]|uniref:AUGMIN subunit 2 n=1 Tax=Dovyalis caffra TaxID=77055 RepID=A0AAV1SF43_9ROSI|nr:unnamed protein product [Dovyalis caffra]